MGYEYEYEYRLIVFLHIEHIMELQVIEACWLVDWLKNWMTWEFNNSIMQMLMMIFILNLMEWVIFDFFQFERERKKRWRVQKKSRSKRLIFVSGT